jgi:hypothetical protein
VTIPATVSPDYPPATAAIEVRHVSACLADGNEPPRPACGRQARQREPEERASAAEITGAVINSSLDLNQQAADASLIDSDTSQPVDVYAARGPRPDGGGLVEMNWEMEAFWALAHAPIIFVGCSQRFMAVAPVGGAQSGSRTL